MKGLAPLMSSARTGTKDQDEWRTPKWLFDRCAMEYGAFDLDAAASPGSTLCKLFYDEEDSALAAKNNWIGNVWCNPPYSILKGFVDKGLAELRAGRCRSITFLIPARTDTKAFQMLANSQFCFEVVFLKGRVKFEPGDQSAPFPSAVIHLRRRHSRREVYFQDWRPV